MTTRFLTALAVSGAVALAGCGSSSKTTSSTSSATSSKTTSASVTSPTTSAFLGTLGALCVHANAAFNNASGVKAQSAVVSRYVAKFRALKPPPQLRTLYSQYLGVLQLESAALKAGNTAGLQQLVTTRARPLAKKLGAAGCVT
jgi:hypothetical protein